MKDLPAWSDLNKGVRKMTDKEFDYCEEMEKRKHDDKLKELREVQLLSQHILDLQKDKGKLTDRARELEQQIEQLTFLHNEDVNTIKLLNEQIREMKCCENCAFFKDKTYAVCHMIKKLGTRKCAFYKMM